MSYFLFTFLDELHDVLLTEFRLVGDWVMAATLEHNDLNPIRQQVHLIHHILLEWRLLIILAMDDQVHAIRHLDLSLDIVAVPAEELVPEVALHFHDA